MTQINQLSIILSSIKPLPNTDCDSMVGKTLPSPHAINHTRKVDEEVKKLTYFCEPYENVWKEVKYR